MTRPAALGAPGCANDLNRLVHDGVCRNALEMEKLVGAEPQHRAHRRVELADRPSRRAGQDRIERALPAERTGNELEEQRAVARFSEWLPRALGFRGQRRASALEVHEHARRSEADWGHGCGSTGSNLSPARTGCPLTNARTGIGGRPSGWISRRRTAPAPVAIRSASDSTAKIVPGAP